ADGNDVFLHIKSCTDGGVPQKGDIVAYDTEPSQTKPGQLSATNVTGGTGTAGGRKAGTGAHHGTCKSFSVKSGFGFINGEDGTDVFLHARQVVDGSIPQQGDTLQFDLEPSPSKPGQMQAKNVTGGTGWGAFGKGGGWGKGGKGGPYDGWGAAAMMSMMKGWGGGGWGGGKGKGGGGWGKGW
ncbi:unnamed protein product, partial [Prorocentrum cordatum]